MNKKGLMGVEIAFLSFALVVSAFSLLPTTRAKFQVKKAVAMCEKTGGPHCAEMVNAWSKSDILAYIKDDSTEGNGGNF